MTDSMRMNQLNPINDYGLAGEPPLHAWNEEEVHNSGFIADAFGGTVHSFAVRTRGSAGFPGEWNAARGMMVNLLLDWGIDLAVRAARTLKREAREVYCEIVPSSSSSGPNGGLRLSVLFAEETKIAMESGVCRSTPMNHYYGSGMRGFIYDWEIKGVLVAGSKLRPDFFRSGETGVGAADRRELWEMAIRSAGLRFGQAAGQ